MKNKEINKLSKDELENKLDKLKKDLFNMRFKKANGPLEDTSKLLLLKKNVARILTKKNQKIISPAISLEINPITSQIQALSNLPDNFPISQTKTYKQAYELVEQEYEKNFKKRKYADYNSYRNCLLFVII